MATLTTGGTGFVGLEVVRRLDQRGVGDLTVFSRNPSASRLDDLAGRVETIAGDVGNFSHVLDAVREVRPEVIYHLGAMLSVPSDADPAASIQTNAMGTFYVLEAARLFDVRQVIFSSSVGTYGYDVPEASIDDRTLQRPQLFYGATKVFGEHMGRFYKRKYGLDFRGIRYPSVIGPGVSTPGAVQYTSWMIEQPARGNPFKVWVAPETRMPVMYIKDAAEATCRLAEAPVERIETVSYIVDGAKPTPSAGELAAAVRERVAGARIEFEPDPDLQPIIDQLVKPLDDSRAAEEWGWSPTYDLAGMVDDFLASLRA